MSSPAARLTEWLNWAEVGAFYFAGSWLTLLTYGFNPTALPLASLPATLLLLTVLSLPYTVWSVWYQARIARQACLLCLTVQLLLWAEWLIGFPQLANLPTALTQISPEALSVLTVCFLLPVVLLAALKPSLQKAVQHPGLNREFQRLKFNPDYLQTILNKPRFLPPIFEGMKVIRMGNSLSINKLTLISSPSCSLCRQIHINLHKLLQSGYELDVQILLAASTVPSDIAGQVTRQILSLPPEQMADALHLWYTLGEGSAADWNRIIKSLHTDESALHQQLLHLRWIELAGISSTPSTYLNGLEVPKIYTVQELPKLCAASQLLEQAGSHKSISSL